jgi:hypothetical protein
MSASKASLDFSAIEFPSDRVTIGKMRKLLPAQFTPTGLKASHFEAPVLHTLLCEQVLAEQAFAAAAGLPSPHTLWDRRESILALNSDYCRFGISSGLQQTYQLVRRFEQAAVDQWKAPQGPSRGR